MSVTDKKALQRAWFIDVADAQSGDPLLDVVVLTLWSHELTPFLLEGYEAIKDNGETQNLIRVKEAIISQGFKM